jgi:hypothetical protein
MSGFTQFLPGTTIAELGTCYYRMLDANGDYTMGYGAANWWGFQPEGVAQSAFTRLLLVQGSWFLDTTAGLPLFTKILGKSSPATRDLVIKRQILGTTNLTRLLSFSSTVDASRNYRVSATVLTAFSTTPIATPTLSIPGG